MLKIYITIFFLTFFNLSAEIIQTFKVNGNVRISDETIKVYGDFIIGKDYSSFEINDILKNLYETNFFDDIKINLSNGILDITVKEYAIINFIEFQGEKNKKITKGILKSLQLKPKESFIENKLSQDIGLIKKLYASIGFNFAKVEAKIEKFENNRINLIYFLDKGKKTNISKISFVGEKIIKDRRLRDVIASEENKFWKFISRNTFLNNQNIELDKRLLTNYYKSLGYYDVQILSSSAEVSLKNLTHLTYTINAGTRYKVNKISTNVSDVLDKKLFLPLQDSFTKVIGKYYSPFTTKKLLDELDDLIVDNDLQFIEHSVNEIIENDSIELKINIFEGKKKLVEKINITGNTITEEAVIRAELLLDEGDPFNTLKLEQSLARLRARNIFGEIKNKIIKGSDNDQQIIEIIVEEKATGEISAGAGVGTNGGSFEFQVNENNWLGKGIRVGTSFKAAKGTLAGGLSVTDPNFNYSGNSLLYFLTVAQNEDSASGYQNNVTTTGIGTSFEQYRNIYLSPNLTLSHDDLKIGSTSSTELKKQGGTFTDLTFDYSVSLDNRDKVYSPTDGYLSTFSQGIPVYADAPFIKNAYAFAGYGLLSPDVVGSIKFYSAAINSLDDSDVRLSKRINIPRSRLRGFEGGKVGPKDGKDYIGGNYAMAANFEVSLPKLLPETTKTDVGLFLDFGNLWHVDYDKSVEDSNKVRSSAGVLTSWLSPVGPMTFTLSQNLSKATTDVTETFNFQLGTTF